MQKGHVEGFQGYTVNKNTFFGSLARTESRSAGSFTLYGISKNKIKKIAGNSGYLYTFCTRERIYTHMAINSRYKKEQAHTKDYTERAEGRPGFYMYTQRADKVHEQHTLSKGGVVTSQRRQRRRRRRPV